MNELHPPTIHAIRAAQQCLAGMILRTPLLRMELENGPAEIFLKLENLQPTGSFKVRGAGNALLSADPAKLKKGVWTVSAGNMGHALAWYARRLGIACTVIVPEDAPKVKVEAIRRQAAVILKVPFIEYQNIQREGGWTGIKGYLVHPFADQDVMAGNGTIGLEILEDLPEVNTVLVPYGGGGLSCGIATAIKAIQPEIRVEAVEVATAAPLTASFSAGQPVDVPYRSSFVSGMGAPSVFPQMWPLASRLLDAAWAVPLVEVATTIRLLAERQHVIAEGAGAVALAEALSGPARKKVVCVVSGGNINAGDLAKIIQGELP